MSDVLPASRPSEQEAGFPDEQNQAWEGPPELLVCVRVPGTPKQPRVVLIGALCPQRPWDRAAPVLCSAGAAQGVKAEARRAACHRSPQPSAQPRLHLL